MKTLTKLLGLLAMETFTRYRNAGLIFAYQYGHILCGWALSKGEEEAKEQVTMVVGGKPWRPHRALPTQPN